MAIVAGILAAEKSLHARLHVENKNPCRIYNKFIIIYTTGPGCSKLDWRQSCFSFYVFLHIHLF